MITGNSEHIYITYEVTVDGTTPDGTTMTNGAEIGNGIPEEPDYENTSSQPVTVPYPDVTIKIDTPATVLPGQSFPYTITYNNVNRTCGENAYIVHTLPDDLIMP